MSNKVNNAAEQYLREKRTQGRGAYEQGDTSFFEKGIEALTTPFRWGAEGLTSLFLRAQDSTLSNDEAYKLATGNRTGKEWYEAGNAPVTLGQSIYGASTGVPIDWSNTKEVQKFFSSGGQQFLSGGIDAITGLVLDPLNYVGVGLGAKAFAAVKGAGAVSGAVAGAGFVFGKVKSLDGVADLARLESLSARNFNSVTDYFKRTQEEFVISPNAVNGLRVGTPAYAEEVLRLQPYFKGFDEFKNSSGNIDITPLSDSASYLFDGTLIRAVDGNKFFTYDMKNADWNVEPVLSPQVAQVAREQFSHSGFVDLNNVSTRGFESVQDYSKVRRIKSWDDSSLPKDLKFGIWRFDDGTEQYIAWDSVKNEYWALSDKPIQEKYLLDDSNIIEDVSAYDSALYDTLDYAYTNNQFMSASNFYNENPALFTSENEGFNLDRSAKYFEIEDNIYARSNKNFLKWDSENSKWTRVRVPKVKDSNKQLELETRLNEKRDGYINAEDIEDDFADSQVDDFYNEMDVTDEHLGDDPTIEYSSNFVPEGMQLEDVSVDVPTVGAVAEKRWYPMDKSNIEQYGLAYSYRYRDQFGELQQAWIPANMSVLSPSSEVVAENAGKLLFPSAPLIRTIDDQIFTIGYDGSIIDIATAHRQNELYGNFVLEEQYRRAQIEATRLEPFKRIDQPKLTKEEIAAKATELEAVNVERKLTYEQLTAKLELMGPAPTKVERTIFDEVAAVLNDPTRTKPIADVVSEIDKTNYATYQRVREYDAVRDEQLRMARTKQEVDAADEAAKNAARDAEIEDKLLSDPEYKVAAHEWFAQGKSGQRPITISFWYEKKLNENGTYTITQMGRRTDFSGFGDESGALASKEWEIFQWENISIKDLQKMSYRSTQDYPDGLILPNNNKYIKKTIDSNNPTKFWDVISNADEPAVTVNIDELDTFGRVDSRFVSERLKPRRFLSWEKADKKANGYIDDNGIFVPGLVDGLVKRKASAVAEIEKGSTKYAAALKQINEELDYYRTYFTNEVAYENGILDGMVRRELGAGKPELWFLNLEDALNRIANTKHDVNAATVGFMERDVARIAPLTKAEKAAEEAMAKAAKSKRKTEFPIERPLVSEDVAAKPLDVPIPEDIKAMAQQAEERAILKGQKLRNQSNNEVVEEVVSEPALMTMGKIDLFRGENSFLSNMSNSPITINGESYSTVEHAFQAAKFSDPAKRKAIAEAKSPADAKRLGKQSGMRPDWNERRVKIMEDILRAKFDQNAELKQKLIDTGDTELIEGNTWGDKFWGQVDGVGENNLGKLLMKIRDKYRNAE